MRVCAIVNACFNAGGCNYLCSKKVQQNKMNKKVNKPKHKNNHARSKQRIKILLLKNFCKRVMDKKLKKIEKLKIPKGKTIVGLASKQIPFVTRMQKSFYQKGTKNQRQKRRIWRQAPHMRKRA